MHQGTILLKEFERDFNMKKDLDAITKLNPDVRHQRLRQFIDKLTRNPETRKDLDDWKMDFSPDVVKVDANVLPSTSVAFGNVKIQKPFLISFEKNQETPRFFCIEDHFKYRKRMEQLFERFASSHFYCASKLVYSVHFTR